MDVDWPTRRRSMSTNLARERNLFQTVVPLPCGRLAAAARWGWGRHQAVSRARLREWRRTGTKCAARPRRIQFSSKLARRHGHSQHATCPEVAASTPQPQQGSTSALVASRLCSNNSGHRRKPNGVAPTLAYGFFMNDGCSALSPWIRPSQVRLALHERVANSEGDDR